MTSPAITFKAKRELAVHHVLFNEAHLSELDMWPGDTALVVKETKDQDLRGRMNSLGEIEWDGEPEA